jgi:hypothetical protein
MRPFGALEERIIHLDNTMLRSLDIVFIPCLEPDGILVCLQVGLQSLGESTASFLYSSAIIIVFEVS